MTEINWSALKQQADDATKPVPPGDYVVEIKKAEATTASTSGNPMLKVQMTVVEGPQAGKTVFNNFNLTLDSAFAMSIFFRHMEAFGLGTSFFAGGNPSMEAVAQALVGRRAKATLSIRPWQGQDRNQCDNFVPLLGAAAQPAIAQPSVSVPSPSVNTPTSPAGNQPSTPPPVAF